MKKKTLVSILAMTSASMAAYADANVDQIKETATSDWEGADDLTLVSGVFTSPSGTAISQRIEKLVPGKYSLTAATNTNAKISLAGATIGADNTFTLTAESDIILNIESAAGGSFSVGGFTLTLVDNLVDNYKTPLTSALARVQNKIEADGVGAADLMDRVSAIAADIANISDDTKDAPKEAYHYYKYYKLYKGWEASTINEDIKKLSTDVDGQVGNVVAYQTSLALYNTKLQAWQAAVAVFDAITDASDKAYAQAQAAATRTAAEARLTEFKEAIDKAYAEEEAADVCTEEFNTDFQTDMDGYTSTYSTTVADAVADNQAYIVVAPQVEQTKNAYSEASKEIIAALTIDDTYVEDVFVDLRQDAQGELNLVYVDVLAAEKNNGDKTSHNNAAETQNANVEALTAATAKIGEIKTKYTTRAATLKAQYAAALAQLETVQTSLDKACETAQIAALTEDVKGVQGKIDAFKTTIHADNKSYAIETADYTQTVADINSALNALVTKAVGSWDNYQAYQAVKAAIAGLQKKYNGVKDYLDNTKSEDGLYALKGKYDVELATYQTAITNYSTAIEAELEKAGSACITWKSNNQSAMTATGSSIDALKAKAEAGLADYEVIAEKLADYKEALDGFKTLLGSDTDVPVYVNGEPSDETYGGKYDAMYTTYQGIEADKATALNEKTGDEHRNLLATTKTKAENAGHILSDITALTGTFEADKTKWESDVVEQAVARLLAQAETKVGTVNTELDTWDDTYNAANLGKKWEPLKGQKDALVERVNTLTQDIANAKDNEDKAAAMALLVRINSEADLILGDLTSLNTECSSAKAALEANDKQTEEANKKVAAIKAKLNGDGQTNQGVENTNGDPNRTAEFAALIAKQAGLISAQETAISNADAAETMQEEWEKSIKAALEEIEGSVDQLIVAAQASTTNFTYWQYLVKTNGGYIVTSAIETNIAKAKTDLASVTISGAATRTYYEGVISGYETEFSTIKTDIDKSYDERKFTSVDLYNAYKGDIDALNNNVKAVKGNAEKNEKAYTSQLNDANYGYETVNKYWEDTYFRISTEDQTSAVEGYLKQLTDEQTKLQQAKTELEGYYAKGESVDKDATVMAALKAIKDAVKEVDDTQRGNYGNTVLEDNEARWDIFDDAVEAARAAYTNAVNTILAFSLLENDYGGAVTTGVEKANATINGQLEALRGVQAEAEADRTEKESGEPPLPFDEKETYKAQAEEIQKLINGALKDLNDEVNTVAKGEFLTRIDEQNALLTAAQDELANANYTQAVRDAAFPKTKGIIDAAQAAYDKADEAGQNLALAIDGYLTQFATIPALLEEEKEDAAQAEWTAESGRVSGLIQTQLADLNKWEYPNDPDGELKQDYIDNYTAIKEIYYDEAVAYRAEQTVLYGTAMARLKQYLSDFEREAVTYVYEVAKAANANKVASDAAYGRLIVKVNGLYTKLDEVTAFADKYVVDSYENLKNLEESIDVLSGDVEDDKVNGGCANHESRYDGSVTTITAALNTFMDNLNNQAELQIKADFNVLVQDQNRAADAVEGTELVGEVDGYIAKIDDLVDRFDAAIKGTGEIGKETDPVKKQALYLGYQDEAAQMRKELAVYYEEGLTLSTYENLMEKVDAVAATQASLAESLDGMHANVQAEYRSDVEDAAASVSGIRAAIEAKKETVIYYEAKFTNDISHLTDELNTLQAAMEAEQAIYVANQEAYDRLTGELGVLRAQYDETVAMIESYKYYEQGTHWNELLDIEDYLWADEEMVKSRYEAYQLTASSALQYKSQVESGLNTVAVDATYAEKDGVIVYEAEAKLIAIENMLDVTGKNYRYTEEALADLQAEYDWIEGRMNTLKTFNNSARYGYINYDIDGNYVGRRVPIDYMEEAVPAIDERIAELNTAMDALETDAEAVAYILGDVDRDKAVLVNDYTQVMKYVVEEETVEDGSMEFLAADVNEDGNINIGDATAVANAILRADAQGTSAWRNVGARVVLKHTVESPDAVEMTMEENGGTTRIAIRLSYTRPYVACQMDVHLPAGVSLLGETLGACAGGHQLFSNTLADGTHRIAVSSLENEKFSASGDALVYLEVSGKAASEITVSNVLAADGQAVVYSIGGNGEGVTGIQGVQADQSLKEKIYSVGGQVMDKLTRGINIIRNADGTTKKVLKK